MKLQANQRGVAALLTIVIIGAATSIMALTAMLLGIGDMDMAYTSQRGAEAFSVADGCMEETLHRIRLDTDYGVDAGEINVTVSNGSCIIEVTDLGSDQRRIEVTSTSDDYHKRIQVDLTLSGNVIAIDNWEERSD